MSLNYKHLRYFWAVAHGASLTRAASQLHVSQSALSVQIRKLEDWLGQELFERQGKRLVLTEAGRIALDYADTIFGAGAELVSTLRGRDTAALQVLRVGALSTLSRNLQMRFLRPLFDLDQALVVVRSGGQQALLADLESHAIDVVLTNLMPQRDAGREWLVHPLAEQQVSLVGNPARLGGERSLAHMLASQPIVVPTMENSVRVGFDALCDRLGVRPTLRAEIDDMALLRVLARADVGLAVVPPIVVRDELESGALEELAPLPGLTETFHAITLARRFPNPLLPLVIGPPAQPVSA